MVIGLVFGLRRHLGLEVKCPWNGCNRIVRNGMRMLIGTILSTTAANNNNDTDCTTDKCATITP